MISEPKYYITSQYTTQGTNGLELFSDSRSLEVVRGRNHDKDPESLKLISNPQKPVFPQTRWQMTHTSCLQAGPFYKGMTQ